MTSIEKPKTIGFLGNEYKVKELGQAILKSSIVEIEEGKEVHPIQFDQSQIPAEWNNKHGLPVLTIHEGKYVIILNNFGRDVLVKTTDVKKMKRHNPNEVESVITTHVTSKKFKAVFVTKYNFNQAKFEIPKPEPVEPTPPPVNVYDLAKCYEKNTGARYNNNRPNGQQNQNGGFKNNNHRGGNRY
jgi:hypothetical protein